MRTNGRLIVPACLMGFIAVGCGKPNMSDMHMPSRPAELDKLEPMVGSWTYSIEFTMEGMPGPIKGTGTSTVAWDCEKNVLVEHVNGDPDEQGHKFSAMGLYMYDTHGKVFRTVWIDNMGEVHHGTMKLAEDGKTWHTRGTGMNTYTGEKGKGVGEMKWVDNNTMEFSGKQYDSWGFSKKMDMKGTSKRKM